MACMMMASRRASAIRGFHGVTLLLEDAAKSGAILTNVFGFEAAGREGSISRYRAPNAAGGVVDIYEAANVMLTRYNGPLKLKDWALAIAKRSTLRKARIALARRLAIIMHAMLRHGTEFKPA